MKKVMIAAVLLLSACATTKVPVVPDSVAPPVLPPALAKKAVQLPPIKDNTMGGAEVQGAQDDQQYNAVAWQLNQVIDVYNCVRTGIINHTDLNKCL